MSDNLTTLQRMHIAEVKLIAERLRGLGIDYLGTGHDDPDGKPGARYYLDPFGLFEGQEVKPHPVRPGKQFRRRDDLESLSAVLIEDREGGGDDL